MALHQSVDSISCNMMRLTVALCSRFESLPSLCPSPSFPSQLAPTQGKRQVSDPLEFTRNHRRP